MKISIITRSDSDNIQIAKTTIVNNITSLANYRYKMKTLNSKLATLVLVCILSITFNSSVLAEHRKSHDDTQVRIFTSYESNGEDYIEGIGVGFTFKNSENKMGFQLNTSLNNAEVRATDGYIEDYFAWQGSAKFGLFSNVSIYVEAGIDLTELIFHDFRYDDHHGYDDHYHYEDDIDVFVGLGAGIKLGHLKLEGFSRLREIDSRYWEAESEVFTGVQFSLNF